MAGVRRRAGPAAALATSLVASTLALLGAARPTIAHRVAPRLFAPSGACVACHSNLRAADGEDVSIGYAWRSTMMANASRDPYWQASLRREVLERPGLQREIEDECATCHMPMAARQARADGRHVDAIARLPLVRASAEEDVGDADDALAADGVSCSVCHQVAADRLGDPSTFNGRFAIDTVTRYGRRRVFGPHDVDAGRTRIMHTSSEFVPTRGDHIRASELCATCHTLHTEARDAAGRIVGRLPEQVPYQEWRHSGYAGADGKSCQACHMPVVADSTAISGVWGQPRPGLARHEFLGGNFLVLGMLDRYRTELGVRALPEELAQRARRTMAHLGADAARVSVDGLHVDGTRLAADVVVRNLGGHKLPTAYPSRRAWLHVVVRDADGRVVFESGRMNGTGAIVGDDNDADAATFEPHYREITRADQVQIYEPILGDATGHVTTVLLSAVGYLKDNRLLPEGFDKRTAGDDIAVHGDALDDPDFAAGGDRVRYVVDVSHGRGPFRMDATLRYQPIGFRWAKNLGPLAGHGAPEIDRFGAYYDAMASGSSAVLAAGSATAR